MLRKQLQEKEETRAKVEVNYNNFQKVYEFTKKENNRYHTEIIKLKNEKDNVEEVMKALHNANFNQLQISSATDKEKLIQKLLIQYWKKDKI